MLSYKYLTLSYVHKYMANTYRYFVIQKATQKKTKERHNTVRSGLFISYELVRP